MADTLFGAEVGVSDVATLEEIASTGKAKPKAQARAIAHGLAFDPHVDGKLRLTPPGRAKLTAARSQT